MKTKEWGSSGYDVTWENFPEGSFKKMRFHYVKSNFRSKEKLTGISIKDSKNKEYQFGYTDKYGTKKVELSDVNLVGVAATV